MDTDTDTASLTAEEREALAHLDADDDEDGAEATDDGADRDGQEAAAVAKSEDGTSTGDKDPPADPAEPAPPTAKDAAGAEDGAKPDGTPPPAAPAATSFPRFEAPADAGAKIEEIQAKLDKLADDFDNGELTASELRAQSRELEQQQRDLQNQVFKAEMSAQARTQEYQQAVRSFLAAHPEYQVGSEDFEILNTILLRIQNDAIAKGHDPNDPSLLNVAHQRMLARSGQAMEQPKDPEPTPGKKKIVLPDPPPREMPPNFGNIPASAEAEIEDPVMQGLRNLKGPAFEAAFAKLSEDAREAFLARLN